MCPSHKLFSFPRNGPRKGPRDRNSRLARPSNTFCTFVQVVVHSILDVRRLLWREW